MGAGMTVKQRFCRPLGVLMLLLLPSSSVLCGQEQEIPPLSYSVDVQVFQIRFSAFSKTGQWIDRLTPGDLELYVDGRKQQIEYLDEMTPEGTLLSGVPAPPGTKAGPASPPEQRKEANHLIVIFDGNNTSSPAMEKHKKYARELIERLPKNQITYLVYFLHPGSDYSLLAGPTEDKKSVLAAMEKAQGTTSAGNLDRQFKFQQLSNAYTDITNCPREEDALSAQCQVQVCTSVIEKAKIFAQEERNRISHTIADVSDIARKTASLPGRKSVLLVTEGLEPTGGNYFNQAANILRDLQEMYSISHEADRLEADLRYEAAKGSPELSRINELENLLTASGFTLYFVHPDLDRNTAEMSAEHRSGHPATRKLINSPDPDLLAWGLAEHTGGTALARGQDRLFYSRMVDYLTRYYLLGYRLDASASEDKTRELNVILKSKKTDVVLSFPAKAKYLDLQGRIEQALAAAHNSPNRQHPMPLSTGSNFYKLSDREYQVWIPAAVPLSSIQAATRQDQQARDEIHFSFLVRDASGNIVAGDRRMLQLDIPAEQIDLPGSNQILLQAQYPLILKPGKYNISVAALDTGGWSTGWSESSLDLPAAEPDNCPVASTLLLTSGSHQLSASPGPGFLIGEEGKIAYQEKLYDLSLQPVYPTTGSLKGFYEVSRTPPGGGPPPPPTCKIYDSNGTVVFEPPTMRKEIIDGPWGATVQFVIPYWNLQPGAYALEITFRTGCNRRAAFRIALS